VSCPKKALPLAKVKAETQRPFQLSDMQTPYCKADSLPNVESKVYDEPMARNLRVYNIYYYKVLQRADRIVAGCSHLVLFKPSMHLRVIYLEINLYSEAWTRYKTLTSLQTIRSLKSRKLEEIPYEHKNERYFPLFSAAIYKLSQL
jgi:hypothetical protein